jgi:hypothetical protein
MLRERIEYYKEKAQKNFIIVAIYLKIRHRLTVSGIMIIETVLTIQIFFCLIFVIIELMKINMTQTAIDAMVSKATFDFIATGRNKNFSAIIEEYRPTYIPKDNIRYWFRFYPNLANLCQKSPYGGEDITWPKYEDGNQYLSLGNEPYEYVPSSEKMVEVDASTSINDFSLMTSYINDGATPVGTAFVLTVVCDYPFSNPCVKVFFSGGHNTLYSDSKTKGTRYLLWGRGVGVVGGINME